MTVFFGSRRRLLGPRPAHRDHRLPFVPVRPASRMPADTRRSNRSRGQQHPQCDRQPLRQGCAGGAQEHERAAGRGRATDQERLVDNEAHRLGLTIGDDAARKDHRYPRSLSDRRPVRLRPLPRDARARTICCRRNTKTRRARHALRHDAQRWSTATRRGQQRRSASAPTTFRRQRSDCATSKLPYSSFEAGITPTDQEIAEVLQRPQGTLPRARTNQDRLRALRSHWRWPASYAATEPEIQDYYEQNLKTEFTHPARFTRGTS